MTRELSEERVKCRAQQHTCEGLTHILAGDVEQAQFAFRQALQFGEAIDTVGGGD